MYDDARPGYQSTIHGAAKYPWVIGAAWPRVRKEIAAKIADYTEIPAWENGVLIMHGAELGFDVTVGQHVHVGSNATVSHGCVLGDFAHICPGAQLAGDVWVGEGAFVGIGAVVRHGGIRIGVGATVGAGAVVVKHVPDGATVMGNPARVYRP